ncbi:MAG: drug resistance transporter, EmrB/QacA subfamily [Chloroflexi bacterium]|nr:drug resistance transporter, EmrB/QacA subfamily [Chloroflexota bacterium]
MGLPSKELAADVLRSVAQSDVPKPMSSITPTPNRWLGLLALSLSVLSVVMTGTSVNLALPAISTSFGVSISNLTWIIDAYTLTLGALTLPGGTLGDIFGRRRMYLIGLGVFSVGALFASLAPNLGLLIIARVLMAIGASLVLPGTLSLISSMFEGRERATAIGLWGGINGIGLALGPVLGGALVEYVDWRAVFWTNIPLVALVFFMVPRYVPAIPPRSGLHQLDVPGAVTVIGALTALIVALIEGPTWGWSSPSTVGCLALAVLLLAAFIAIESHVRYPMVPLHIFRSRTLNAACLSAAFLMISILSAFFFLSLFLQGVLGFSGIQTGLGYLPLALLIVGLSPLAGQISTRFGPRLPIVVGLLLAPVGLLWMSNIDAGSGYSSLVGGLLLVGAGMGLASPPISYAAVSSAPRDLAGVASGLNVMARQVGGSLGVALLTAIFAGRFRDHLSQVLRSSGIPAGEQHALLANASNLATAGSRAVPHADPKLVALLHSAFVLGMSDTLRVLSGVGILGVLAALMIRERDLAPGRPAPQQEAVLSTSPPAGASAAVTAGAAR